MIKKWRLRIPELTGRKTRRAYIYIPDEAMEDEEARYPVLYMFDGHNVFFDSDATYGKSWGMKKYMDESGLPLIIVAVECNHSPDNGRLSEYSPSPSVTGSRQNSWQRPHHNGVDGELPQALYRQPLPHHTRP